MASLRRPFVGHVGILFALLICIAIVPVRPVRQARPRVILPEHEARIVEFSPDSRVMVTDGDSGGCVRDAATGLVLSRLMRNNKNGASRATNITWPHFTADGRRLIVQLGGPRFGRDRTITLAVFEVATGREAGVLRGSRFEPLVRLVPTAPGIRALRRWLDPGVHPNVGPSRGSGDGLGRRCRESRSRIPGYSAAGTRSRWEQDRPWRRSPRRDLPRGSHTEDRSARRISRGPPCAFARHECRACRILARQEAMGGCSGRGQAIDTQYLSSLQSIRVA